MNKIISLKNVYFGYDSNLIIENLSLDIYEGDYIGIIGANGSAKSTLLKLMLNRLKPLKGDIKLFNDNVMNFKDWSKIGYVDQKSTAFNKSFPATVEEVVGLNLFSQIGLFKPISKKYLEKVHEALKVVGMENYKKRLIGNLSGGQQQKVFIAKALVNSPKIIFLDEPTVGIDLKSQREFYDLLDELNRKMNITIVMVSHDIGIVREKVSKIGCMANGSLTIHENCKEISINALLNEMYSNKMILHINNFENKGVQ